MSPPPTHTHTHTHLAQPLIIMAVTDYWEHLKYPVSVGSAYSHTGLDWQVSKGCQS